MTNHRFRITLLALVIVTAALPRGADAECLVLEARSIREHSAVAFSGKVTAIRHLSGAYLDLVDYEADRVWKGKVDKRMTVAYEVGIESTTHVVVDQRYVVATLPIADLVDTRAVHLRDAGLFKIPDYFVPMCWDKAVEDAQGLLAELGPGAKP